MLLICDYWKARFFIHLHCLLHDVVVFCCSHYDLVKHVFFLPRKVLQSCLPCVSRTFWTAMLVCCHYMHIISQKRSKIITGKRSSLSKQNAATVALSCTKKLQICLNFNIKAIKEPPPPPPSSSCLTSPSTMHPPSPHQQRDPQKLPNWRAYPPFHKSKSPDT